MMSSGDSRQRPGEQRRLWLRWESLESEEVQKTLSTFWTSRTDHSRGAISPSARSAAKILSATAESFKNKVGMRRASCGSDILDLRLPRLARELTGFNQRPDDRPKRFVHTRAATLLFIASGQASAFRGAGAAKFLALWTLCSVSSPRVLTAFATRIRTKESLLTLRSKGPRSTAGCVIPVPRKQVPRYHMRPVHRRCASHESPMPTNLPLMRSSRIWNSYRGEGTYASNQFRMCEYSRLASSVAK